MLIKICFCFVFTSHKINCIIDKWISKYIMLSICHIEFKNIVQILTTNYDWHFFAITVSLFGSNMRDRHT